MSDALILGFDSSAAHCAAALLSGDRLLAVAAEDMDRGQAERLIPLVQEMLTGAGVTWTDLDRIGVGIGPGNFTGIRISVSAARGLALSLGIPAVGVSGFEAISRGQTEPHLPTVPAPRDQVYILSPGAAPQLVPRDDALRMGLPLCLPPEPGLLAERIARVAAARDTAHVAPPAPLYLRPADAAPARDLPPVILDDDA